MVNPIVMVDGMMRMMKVDAEKMLGIDSALFQGGRVISCLRNSDNNIFFS